MFDDDECRVYFKDELVLIGGRDAATGLWQLPINPVGQARQASTVVDHLDLQVPESQVHHAANGLVDLTCWDLKVEVIDNG